MNDLKVELGSSARRKMDLKEYFYEQVIYEDRFVCPLSAQCKASHKDIFYEGQLHHVGNHYDISIFDKPFRVMVVGQEYGHGPSHVSMEDRSKMVLEQTGFQKSFSRRNPHMRGTTSVLRLLFGIPLGREHSDEYLHSIDGDKFHLFDSFALVNYLLCSAVSSKEGRRGKSTPIMRRNCLGYFNKTVEILDPNVIVVQGKAYWASIQKAFNKLLQISDTLFKAEINQHIVLIAVFTHPSTPDNSHNWGRDEKTKYLLETVVPTIELIRQDLIPHIDTKGVLAMTPIYQSQTRSSPSNDKNPSYDTIFEQIQAGLNHKFPPGVTFHNPSFEHSAPNRLRIFLDEIKGSHYEICFRRAYYEFALHFESTPALNLERRQPFDSSLDVLTNIVGILVRSGPLENKGRMRIWYEQKHEPIDRGKIIQYIDLYSRFITATFPILLKVYKNS